MLRINKSLCIIILLCFFLPFVKGCDGFLDFTIEEKLALEKSRADSIASFNQVSDSVDLKTNDTLSDASLQKNDSSYTPEAVEKRSFLSELAGAVLLPGGEISGIALVLTGWDDLSGLTSIEPAFIFLILMLFAVFKKEKNYRRIFIFSALAFFFLFLFMLYFFSEVLYGYWLALSLTLINTFVAYLSWKEKRAENNPG
jgi:hypothetical protein